MDRLTSAIGEEKRRASITEYAAKHRLSRKLELDAMWAQFGQDVD